MEVNGSSDNAASRFQGVGLISMPAATGSSSSSSTSSTNNPVTSPSTHLSIVGVGTVGREGGTDSRVGRSVSSRGRKAV